MHVGNNRPEQRLLQRPDVHSASRVRRIPARRCGDLPARLRDRGSQFKTAAYWGYGPAAYSLGVMYFRGQGVHANKPLGAAWMTLAGTYGSPEYSATRDLMVTSLTDTQFAETDHLWSQMRSTYSREATFQRAQNRWQRVFTSATGSHLGHPMAPLYGTTGDIGVGVTNLGIQYAAMETAGGPYQALDRYAARKTTVGPAVPVRNHENGASQSSGAAASPDAAPPSN